MQVKNFAYTLIVPPGAIIPRSLCSNQPAIGYSRYRSFEEHQQKEILLKLLQGSIPDDTQFSMFYETSKDGRFHCHGVIDSLCMESALEIQRLVNLRLGYRSNSNKIFHFKQEYSKYYEDVYCQKQQGVIIDFQTVSQTVSHTDCQSQDSQTDSQTDSHSVSPKVNYLKIMLNNHK